MLINQFRNLKWWIFFFIVLGVCIQFLGTLGIVYFQRIIDQSFISANYDSLRNLVIIYSLVLLLNAALNYVNELPSSYLPTTIQEKLRVLALEKISNINYLSFQNIGSGKMIKIIENGASAGSNIIFSFVLRIFHELLPTIVFSLIFIGIYNPKIMILIAIGYVIIFILTNLLLKFLYKIKDSILEDQENVLNRSVRGFTELVTFRINNRYRDEIDKLDSLTDGIIQKNVKLRMVHESFFAIFSVFIVAIKFFILFIGVTDVISGETTIGVLVALILFVDRIYSPIAIFNVLFVGYKLDKVTYKRFLNFLDAPEDNNLFDGKTVKNLDGNISFNEVSFSYDSNKILKNVSFSIPSGQSVALVGESGGGKSTIIKLLLGLIKKESGDIKINNEDINKYKLTSLYDNISYVSQEAPIFDDTIKRNIVFDQEVSDKSIYNILKLVNLENKIKSLPEKLETPIGERGMKLSGGEKQRLALARVIAQKRNLIILDEPVSALDSLSEKKVMENILSSFREKSIIIVAHRLQSIKNVDKIIVIKDGNIVDEGNYEYLIENCTYFQELWDKDNSTEYKLDNQSDKENI